MNKIKQMMVTSQTTMLDSLKLRVKLRDYEYGTEASFTPGIGAWPPTRPGFHPTTTGKRAIHPDFRKNCKLVAQLYYRLPIEHHDGSYSIRREAKVGLPYNGRDEETHNQFMDDLFNTKFDFKYLGHYIQGTRIQTDSNKVRNTGFVQLKAIGGGFSTQRHRMINAGPALNHILGILEYDFHHRWLTEYKATFNVVVDEFKDTGYAYALDYKHFEHSLGFDILFDVIAEVLEENGRPFHAMIHHESNYNNHIHFRPVFKNEESFNKYLECGTSEEAYAKECRYQYGEFFGVDDNVKATMEEIRKSAEDMRKLFRAEADCPVSELGGYRVWTNTEVFNSSGVATTATAGKLYSIADTMCRLTEAYGMKWDLDTLDKFLKHELWVRVYNLGDDNLIFFDKNVDFQKFLDVVTGAIVTEEIPVGFLSRLLTNEVSPHYFKNATLNPKSASFFRKLSRERDVFKYKYPSIGFSDSLSYAERYRPFRAKENEIADLFRREYMSFYDIITDLQLNVDEDMDVEDMKYVNYIDDWGKLYRDNVDNPAELLPKFYYAIGPADRTKIINLYTGGNHA